MTPAHELGGQDASIPSRGRPLLATDGATAPSKRHVLH
jgi:hypothetical protein